MFKKLVALALLSGIATPVLADDAGDLVARGAYLATIMDCAGCHMPRAQDGSPIFEAGLSGGSIGFEFPGAGVFWPPNLTSSSAGLGDWSDAQIINALMTGVRPDGRVLMPVMPWPSYGSLTEEDAMALVAYLRSLPPVDTPTVTPVASAEDAVAPFFRVTLP